MNRTLSILALAALLLAPAALVRAADAPAPKPDDKAAAAPHAGKADKDENVGRGWAPGRRMKKRLGLTDEQAAKVEAAFKAQRDADQALFDQMKKDMETLRRQVFDKAPDADIQTTLDRLSAARKKAQASMEGVHAELASILTPTQRAKMVLMRERGFGPGMGGPGMRGPGRPGMRGRDDRKDPPERDDSDDDSGPDEE